MYLSDHYELLQTLTDPYGLLQTITDLYGHLRTLLTFTDPYGPLRTFTDLYGPQLFHYRAYVHYRQKQCQCHITHHKCYSQDK